MSVLTVVEIGMGISIITLSLFYGIYSLILYYFRRKLIRARLKTSSSSGLFPKVSLIVPTYNEEKIISKKIKNIEEIDYPEGYLEAIFVDANSSDRTSKIIEECVENHSGDFKLVKQEERNGYTRGIMEGIVKSEGNIIVLTDTGAYYYSDAMKQLVKHFDDHEVGAVTGKEIVSGDVGTGPKLERSYRFFYDFMREGETGIDSTPDSKGEILAIRKDICQSLASRLESDDRASFDSCIPYEAKLMGYKTIYEPSAMYYEYAPVLVKDRMKQQVRRGTVLVGALLRYKGMLLHRKYGKFGLFIMPAHLVLDCIMPWVFFLFLFCLSVLTIADPLKSVIPWAAAAVVALSGKRSRLFLLSFVQSQLALIMALFRLARGSWRDSILIDTISSTRK